MLKIVATNFTYQIYTTKLHNKFGLELFFAKYLFYIYKQKLLRVLIKFFTQTYNSTNILRDSTKKYLYYSAYYLIVSILLFSGIAKIIDPLPLIKTLEAFKLFSLISLGNEINIFIATTLPILEIGLALLLILKIRLNAALPLTLLLFTSFLFYSIYGYYLGITNDCGCFGDIIKSEFGVGMVVRNFFFLVVVGYLAAKQYKNIY